jgi:hypothetical protein
MNDEYTSFEEKRRHLIADIARQRGELSEAYRNLEKPIHYAEYGLRGFGFVRQNPWIFVAVPALVKVATALITLSTGKAVKPTLRQRQRQRSETEKPKGITGHAIRWGQRGYRLFKLYRRVRAYFP